MLRSLHRKKTARIHSLKTSFLCNASDSGGNIIFGYSDKRKRFKQAG